MSQTFTFAAPTDFNFLYTIYSHGWSRLLPFELDAEKIILKYVFSDATIGPAPIAAEISENDGAIKIEIQDEIADKAKLIQAVRHILRLDDDLSEFYRLSGKTESLEWIAAKKAGRLLRSPTVYEDLVKTICTTNCSWSLTEKMVTNIVEKLGEPAINNKRAFPTAEKMASVDTEFYRTEIRAGYRAAYFAELAESVAGGRINPENWLDGGFSTDELKREMKKIKGVGDYAAENLLKLVGKYEGLALDSWVRAQFYRKHNAAQFCEDAAIKKFYDRFGAWRGLVLWCDMTEKWFDEL